ncbi:MAG: hypothetical protein JW891_16110 [Candidatus Lokiarchaeota archaeon]|nr:hypothetical protein [Candidatus Lokiarchaeota archaeon]
MKIVIGKKLHSSFIGSIIEIIGGCLPIAARMTLVTIGPLPIHARLLVWGFGYLSISAGSTSVSINIFDASSVRFILLGFVSSVLIIACTILGKKEKISSKVLGILMLLFGVLIMLAPIQF